jgi:uncharacterized membrane protein
MAITLIKRRYLTAAEEARVVNAITAAEHGHRGEVQVFLEARYPGDGPLDRARALFEELGLNATREGTGALLYVAVDDHRAAVWAGPGLYHASSPDFWKAATDAVAHGFKTGDRAGGLIRALAAIGDLLLQAAPGDDVYGNELEDRVHQR